LNQTGSYWYHSHTEGQYGDGLRGPIVINDPQAPFKYDEQLVVTLTEWYHDQFPTLIPTYLSSSQNSAGGEPIPYSALMNEQAPGPQFQVKPNTVSILLKSELKLTLKDLLHSVHIDGCFHSVSTTS